MTVGNNLSPTSAKSNPTLEYISEGQPSSLELAFGVELGFSHYNSKIVSESVLIVGPRFH